MKKRGRIIILLILLVIVCTIHAVVAISINQPKRWGAFTNQPVVSYDGKYRAEHGAKEIEGYNVSMIQVDVYDNQTNELLSSFVPARAMDFWGLCWEENTHNIWTQSADVGLGCYIPKDGQWVLDENAVCPESIVSKWD